MVRFHGRPTFLLEKADPAHEVISLSWLVNHKLLYLFAILHLACHGYVDRANGNLFGALALTPGPDAAMNPDDDGLLTLAEVSRLDLRGTGLAILSACQTNIGPQQFGEGTSGLSRAFLIAGAKRVVAGNWLVDDEAAAGQVSYFGSLTARAMQRNEPPDFGRTSPHAAVQLHS